MIAFLSPHNPDEVFTIPIEKLRERPGYWRINPEEYKEALLQRWKGTVFRESTADFPLSWTLPIPETGGGRSYFDLGDNTVSFDLYDTFEEFVLWHRSLIPEERRLYLFLEGIFIPFEIKLTTSAEEIRHFVGAA